MTVYKGQDGIVKVGSDTILEVREFTVEETADTLETTSMGDGARTRVGSLTSFNGSVTCWWDPDDTNGQEALLPGAELTVNFYPEGDTSGDTELAGDIVVTNVTNTQTFDGLVERSFTFDGNGVLTRGSVT